MEQDTKSIESVETIANNPEILDKISEAGACISSCILKKALNKSKQEYNELAEKVDEFSSKFELTEANLESKKSQYYQEHKENEDLTCQLRLTQKEIEGMNQTFEDLSSKVNNLEAKKKELLAQFKSKCEECIDINMQMSDVKLKLMEILEKNQKLEEEICEQKFAADTSNEEGNKLNRELNELKEQYELNEHQLLKCIEEIEDEITQAKDEKRLLRNKLKELKRFIEEYEMMKDNICDASMEIEKCLLRKQAEILRETLGRSFEYKLRNYGMTFISFVFQGLQILLPAVPKNMIQKKDSSNDPNI